MSRTILLFTIIFFYSLQSSAQYFGRNKPRYNQQEFKVTETEHFAIYDYLNNPEKLKELAAAAEVWYDMHQAVLRDSFTEKNPLIIYNDHAGFQQTNAIRGDISVGTGGVTEGLRNRVVFPVAVTNQQTHHVLGHELVHAFQYHMILNGDSTNMRSLANLPLWMVEGLAEYLSIGRIDPHTALWMRDAVQNDDIPKIKDLDNYKYFPYRWGQAFWAFVTGYYGDEAIRPLFENTAKYGMKLAVPMTLGTTVDSLSLNWQNSIKNYYGVWVAKGKKENLPGRTLLNDDNAGKMNISPVLSPNGKYVIFLSEKNLFTTDLFLADARTGKIIKKVSSTVSDGHIDQFNAIESAGTWSPDSKRFAFDVYEKGRSVLIIKDIFKGKKTQKIRIPGVNSFSNPAWSPDGKSIVVSGQVNGQTDLWEYNFKTRKVKRLTNDVYSEILPTWSADGKYLAYSTDEMSMKLGRVNGSWHMNLVRMDMSTGQTENIDVFSGADNMNPQFDKDGNLYFLSNRDGFRNLYRYDFESKKVFQLTKISTGITGITPYSPAISVAEDRDRILFTHYSNRSYVIHRAKAEDFTATEVDPMDVDMVPAALPPFDPRKRDIVNTNLRTIDNNFNPEVDSLSIQQKKFKPKFSLEYLGGSTGVGVYTGNSSFGTQTGLAGGIDMLFGDILGNNQLYTGFALNGEITDAAGQISYINSKNRINWGVSLSHIPYISGGAYYQDPNYYLGVIDTQYYKNGDAFVGWQDVQLLERIFQERVGLFASYPFSVTTRVEIGTAFEYYKQRVDAYYYNYVFDPETGAYRGRADEREKLPGGAKLNLSNISAAFVGDNSYFGLTAPLQGYRYRVGVEQYFGDYNFTTILLDGRKYFYAKPVTFAFRGLGYTRVGGNSSEVFPLYAANSYFVRGYTRDVFDGDTTGLIDKVAGSKLIVANAEIRIPFTGPKRLSLIKSNFLLTDLNFFFDAGLAFYDKTSFQSEDPTPFDGQEHYVHKPILSTGVSLRVNLFNYLVLEPYFALPISAPEGQRKWVFGMNFIPGW
ncbi:MAG: PD40 domain-containing protein [Lewinellaceae bacterium]|nr:PD40 domain-containing protein [Lewinellaceae bacterium]